MTIEASAGRPAELWWRAVRAGGRFVDAVQRANQGREQPAASSGEPQPVALVGISRDREFSPMVSVVMEGAEADELPGVALPVVAPVPDVVDLDVPTACGAAGVSAAAVAGLDEASGSARHDPLPAGSETRYSSRVSTSTSTMSPAQPAAMPGKVEKNASRAAWAARASSDRP